MTTPGGVPNLPLGALTVETLGQQLQDMSAAAMRQRAGQRFPDIFNVSTGGNVLSDLTPFGILTRIWSEINALIAASSPNDITGPEDLPPLLVDFVENLPFVGQFIQLLQALLGVYDGTDETLLQIQELFTPIRGLLQAIIGQYEGDDPVLQGIEVLFIQLRTIVEKFLELTGGNLATVTDKIPVVGDIVTAITGVVVDGNSPIDETFNVLRGWANDLPTIPTLVSVLTGQPADPAAPPGLPALQNWANNILTNTTPVPATNLFGVLPPAAIPSIPVAHINTEAPNLLSQGSFNTPGTISAADGWAWDDSQNRTQGGGGSAKVTCNGTDRRLYSSQTIPVAAGDKIELSAAIKVSGFSGAEGSVNVAIIPFIGSQPQSTIIAGQASSANLTAAASDWVGIGTASPITMNAGVTSIKVRLAVTSAATAGTVWFDSVQCNKAGLLDQAKVTDLPNAWNFIYQGAQGIDPEAIVTGKTVFDLVGALSNPTSLAQTVTNNFGLLQDILNTDPGQVLGTKAVDGGLPLGLGTALADGNFTLDEAWTILGNAAAGTADTITKAARGDFSGVANFFAPILGLFGISTTAKNNSEVNADNIQATAAAVYNGFFGSGGSGRIAEVQETMKNVRKRLDSGYTLQTLNYGSGSQKQQVALFNVTGGSFTLSYGAFTTASISISGFSGSAVQSALEAHVGSGNASVNAYIAPNDASRVNIDVTFAPFVQGIGISGSPTGGTWTLTYKGQTTSNLAHNATPAAVQSALEALSTIGSGNVTVTGTAGSVYYVAFSYSLTSIALLTSSRNFTDGGTITVSTVPDYPGLEYKLLTINSASLTGATKSTAVIPFWARPWSVANAPRTLYAIAFGGGGGGGAGDRRTTNNANETGFSEGGLGGAAGGYIAAELDAGALPEFVYYIVAAGANGRTTGGRTATSAGQSDFGGYIGTQAGQYFIRDTLGYYTTNQSAPGAGGEGGRGFDSASGSAGAPSQLALGGAGGVGAGAGGVSPYTAPAGDGANGANAPLDQKARAGGGGGGGGGGIGMARGGGLYLKPDGTNTTTPPAPAGNGGLGGYPGGGAGGGGGAQTYDPANDSVGVAAGSGGNGGHGVIVLLWR